MASKLKRSGTSRASSTRKPATRPGEDWREETLARMRALILKAAPDMIEERKWRKPSNAWRGSSVVAPP